MSIPIPPRTSSSPTTSSELAQVAVPAMTMPEATAVTTEACPLCMSRTAQTAVKHMARPPRSMTAHWPGEGTTNCAAAKKTGSSMAQKKTSWCVTAYGFEAFSRESSVLTSPKRTPGTNSSSLEEEQLCSSSTEPATTLRKKNLQLPRRLPLSASQPTAKRMPPEPFQPTKTLRTTAAQNTAQVALRRRSLAALGRKGMSSQLRTTARQLTRKATRKAKQTYCSAGRATKAAARSCSTTSAGTRTTSDSVDSVTFGSLPTSLYSKSCHSIPATIDANLLILGVNVGNSLSLIRFSLRFLLAIQITNIIIHLHYPTNRVIFPPINLSSHFALLLLYRIFLNTSTLLQVLQREEMHTDSKWKQSPLRTSSNTSYLTQTRKVPFRTIIKRRNDTISTSQLYQESPNSRDRNVARQLSHSQILSQKQVDPPSPSVDIKDYVKKMVGRPETQVVGSKNQQVDTSRVEDDKLSQRSSRSVMSNSRLGKKEGALLGKPERGAFEQLEKRVEGLIAETLGQFKRQKSTIGIAQWLKTEPGQDETRQKELEELMAWMKELTEKEEIPGQKVDDLNKKIGLIEKLLARESVQAELLQGMYFNWKAQRGNTTSFLSKSVLKESKKYNKHSEDHQIRLHKEAAKSKQIVSKYDSMNTTSYKRPGKEFYIASKEKKSSYSANRQPFPRSSYSAQYLNYGQLAPYAYKPDGGKQYPETSLAVKASTYQQEYTEKLGITKKIDFKELDCYKDKFQNPKISFMNSSKKQPCTKIIDRKSKGKDIKQNVDAAYIKKSQESLLGYMSMSSSNFYRTESQKEYLWHNSLASQSTKDLQLKSQIKDKRLQKLKDSFRALAMRR